VNETLLEKELEKSRGSTNLMDVGHDVFAGWLEIGKKWDPVRDGLEIVNGEFDANGVGHGDQMKDGVGRTTSDVDEDHGVLEGLTSHNVRRLNVLLQKHLDSFSG